MQLQPQPSDPAHSSDVASSFGADLAADEKAFLAEHALKKPLKTLDIWALGVGVVITGEYFGWNLGLKDNGPVAMLIASLLVCLLYLTWVLALTELSVAMPFAGGPLAYGRRAVEPSLGFVMGWSMYLECQFATIATALGTGGYIAFLFNTEAPSQEVKLYAGLGTVLVFLVLQLWGVKEQSQALLWMTYAAIVGLIIFWACAATHFSWDRVWTKPLLPVATGWKSVLNAVPYALWWLVMVETVALAAEEAHEPHRTIPRGLTWAQLTLVALVVLTWLFACGAMDSQDIAATPIVDAQGAPVLDAKGEPTTAAVEYPLAKIIGAIPLGQSPFVKYGFGLIALFGMVASYHAMIYGTSRQAFALGRGGYLPSWLGLVHPLRRTPSASLIVCSLITAAFVVANYWFPDAISVALLISTLAALIWYILAMGCLFTLRLREPGLFSKYRAPVTRTLPVCVVLLSLFACYVYAGIDVKVIPLTAGLYGVALMYYWFWARPRLAMAAPEEISARQSRPLHEEH